MERKTKICPKCNAKNSPNARFCENCGAELNAVSNDVSNNKQQICPACGTENKSGAKYCEKCSTALDAQNIARSNGRNRGFGMQKNRWWILLIPIIAVVIFYLMSTVTVSSTCASDVCLPGGHYTFMYSNLSSVAVTVSGTFRSNITTTWIAGPSTLIYAWLASPGTDTGSFLPFSNYNLSSITDNIILLANTTAAHLNITFPAGNYTIAVWGLGFSADGINVTVSS